MSHPTKFIKVLTPIALAISLAACGGGGGSFGDNGNKGTGTGTGTENPGVTVSSIIVGVSNSEVGSDSTVPVVLTATARNGSNEIKGADIEFSVYSNAGATALDPFATVANMSTTGAKVSAELTPGSAENRTLYVRAKSGNYFSDVMQVKVVGTTVVIDGPDAIGFSTTAPFLLKLKNSANQPISGADVVLTSKNHNKISDTNYSTDGNGEIAFKLTAISSGNDVITAKVLGTSFTKMVAVSPDEFLLKGSTQDIVIKTPETINFEWKVNGSPKSAGEKVFISATRGVVSESEVTINASGQASFTITSPRAGQTVITATSVASGLATSMTREFIATTPKYLNSQADPSILLKNGTSTIVAKVFDEDGNPVKNKVVSFNVDGGSGSLSAATATTDSLGRATVSYTAGNSSSGEKGVKVTTSLQGNTTVPNDDLYLTVGGEATRLVLGHGNKVGIDGVKYVREYSVFVTDNAGQPIAGKKVSLSIKPINYYKGEFAVMSGAWEQIVADRSTDPAQLLQSYPTKCKSEDFNNDGVLNIGEDDNFNGTLEPTHDANVSINGSDISDANGEVKLKVVYPKNTALWSKQRLTASIQSEGTEFVEYTDFILPMAAADIKSTEINPPNVLSPYGQALLCTDPN